MPLPNLYPLVSASAAVKALIGNSPVRFFRHGSAPQGVTLPYATHRSISGVAQNALSGIARVDETRVQVSCWSADAAQVEALATAIRKAIEPRWYIMDYRDGGRDAETMNYRIDMDVQVYVDNT